MQGSIMRLHFDKVALSCLLTVGLSAPATAQEASQTSTESLDEASESVGEKGENADEEGAGEAKKTEKPEKAEAKKGEGKVVTLVEAREANDPTDSDSETSDVGYRVELDPAPHIEDKPEMQTDWVVETLRMGTARPIRECLDKAFKGEPMATGTLVIERTINKKGRSIGKEIHDNDFDDELTDCLVGATRTRRYLRPKGPPYLDVFVHLKVSSIDVESGEPRPKEAEESSDEE
jgi:uncharacterized low-complexity protein